MRLLNPRSPAFGILLLIIVYAVGIAGVLIPLHEDFMKLTPLNLLFSMVVLFAYSNWRNIWFMRLAAIVFLAGMGVEILGVQTDFPFGAYYYGDVLGPKVFGVPLLIGFNWFFLVYATVVIARQFKVRNVFLTAALAALVMVGYDYLLEPVAVHYDFWTWEAGFIPLSNYIAWFVISFLFCLPAAKWLAGEKNQVALPLLSLQCVFFVIINLWNI